MTRAEPNSASRGDAESDLHACSWAGDIDRVQDLLSKGADPNWRDSIGETAIFGAAGWGHTGVVRLLLAHGARHDVVEQTVDWTALHWAARTSLEITEALVEAGADAHIADRAGRLPIDVAQSHGKGDIVAYLKTVGPSTSSGRSDSAT